MNERSTADRTTAIVRTAFAKFDVRALAIATGTLMALAVFGPTAFLLVMPADSGQPVGPHLGLLAHYFPGYSVSWPGSLIGAGYGFLAGALVGAFFAASWNLAHLLYVMIAVIRRGTGSEL